jgi:hypothetical protein
MGTVSLYHSDVHYYKSGSLSELGDGPGKIDNDYYEHLNQHRSPIKPIELAQQDNTQYEQSPGDQTIKGVCEIPIYKVGKWVFTSVYFGHRWLLSKLALPER